MGYMDSQGRIVTSISSRLGWPGSFVPSSCPTAPEALALEKGGLKPEAQTLNPKP